MCLLFTGRLGSAATEERGRECVWNYVYELRRNTDGESDFPAVG